MPVSAAVAGESQNLTAGSAARRLRCVHCGATYPVRAMPSCPACAKPGEHALNETLVVDYDLAAVRASWADSAVPDAGGLWRWRSLLPVSDAIGDFDVGVGDTPLVALPRLVPELGTVLAKLEGANPTGSFKDRPVAVAATAALAAGARELAVFTSGNVGAALAAFAARAGVPAHIFLLPGAAHAGSGNAVNPEKLRQVASYGADLLTTQGDLDQLLAFGDRLTAELGWTFLHQYQPYEAEGDKTLAFEVCVQSGFSPPDVVVVPVGTGSNLVGIHRGFEQFHQLGLIERVPRLIAVQPAGAASLERALAEGLPVVPTLTSVPPNVAPPISHRVCGQHALDAVRRAGGTAVGVTDAEIADSRRLLAQRAGILTEAASAATLAGAVVATRQGHISPDETVLLILTSHGLKDMTGSAPMLPVLRFVAPSADVTTLVQPKVGSPGDRVDLGA